MLVGLETADQLASVIGGTSGVAALALAGVTARQSASRPPAAAEEGPVVIGPIPPRAVAFEPRRALRERIDAARTAASGGSVVVTQLLTGGGGVGKSQLAAAYARDAQTRSRHRRHRVELVVWTDATGLQEIIATYAQAARTLAVPGAAGEEPEADARAFVNWLHHSERRWLVVLDNVDNLTETDPWWWPTSDTGHGWVLATTRLRDARITAQGNTVDIDVYTPDESAAYLRRRLADAGHARLLDEKTDALCEELGHLPLALGHAAAYLVNENITATEYLRRLRTTTLERAVPAEGHGREVAATLLLTLTAIRGHDRDGITHPLLGLLALLDPAGIPEQVCTAEPTLVHLTEHRQHDVEPDGGDGTLGPVTAEQARSALRLLHRYSLITHEDDGDGPAAIRIHALTARAIREQTASHTPAAARAAADTLANVWWRETLLDRRDLIATLRANTTQLTAHSNTALLTPDAHLLLFVAGRSLTEDGLHQLAVEYWAHLAREGERLLGEEHRHTLVARNNLAGSYRDVGRTDEAIALAEEVHAVHTRLLEDEHRDTPHIDDLLANLDTLAMSYLQAGRTEEAIALEELILDTREELLREDHVQILDARNNLASAYREAGRTDEAIALEERVLATRERVLGEDHLDTLTARNNLAHSYSAAGRMDEAIALEERVLATRERVLGRDHPDTIGARESLAVWRDISGRE
ncbi:MULTISPECIES: tetratricopeptide repeat protein [Streptomyces]|uniref:tetratricopeptide repeat protein n=1 Tax=Streptomyces TaxID=1883 RepID=UPI00178C381A|nr:MULTISPECIES: tetratricopeptide repeat protein [Streptomyces]MCC8452846.1 tetratricopeptide repeat protein [Streptomyces rochei]